MDFLDELKGRASRRQPSVSIPMDPISPTLPGPVQAEYPRLQLWFAFLHELSDLLRIVDPEVTFSYGIKDLCVLTDLRQGDYDVVLRDKNKPRFSFDFFCQGGAQMKFSVETRPTRLAIQEYLEKHRIRYRVLDQASWQYVFLVEQQVPVSFSFEPEPAKNCLRVDTYNVDLLGASTMYLDYAAINRELMCEFAKRVLRKANRFAELTGHRLSDDMRKRLQEKIAASKKIRREERDGKVQPSGTRGRAPGLLQGLLKKKVKNEPAVQQGKRAAPDQVKAREARPPRTEKPAADDLGGAAQKRSDGNGEDADMPRYAWMITDDYTTDETSASVGKLGPSGATKRFAVKAIVEQGEHFRLRDVKGQVAYSGYIFGHYSGIEPLLDYGMHRRCVRIEIERGGNWVALDPKTIELDGEAH